MEWARKMARLPAATVPPPPLQPNFSEVADNNGMPRKMSLADEFSAKLEYVNRIGTLHSESHTERVYPKRNPLTYTHDFGIIAARIHYLKLGVIVQKYKDLPAYHTAIRNLEDLLDPRTNHHNRWALDWLQLAEAGSLGTDIDALLRHDSQAEEDAADDIVFDLDVINTALEGGLWDFNGDDRWMATSEVLLNQLRTPVQYDIFMSLSAWRRQWLAASQKAGRINWDLIETTVPVEIAPELYTRHDADQSPYRWPWVHEGNHTRFRNPEYWLFTTRWQFYSDHNQVAEADPTLWRTVLRPSFREHWNNLVRDIPLDLDNGPDYGDMGPFPLYRMRTEKDVYGDFFSVEEGTWALLPRPLGAATSAGESVVTESVVESTAATSTPPTAGETQHTETDTETETETKTKTKTDTETETETERNPTQDSSVALFSTQSSITSDTTQMSPLTPSQPSATTPESSVALVSTQYTDDSQTQLAQKPTKKTDRLGVKPDTIETQGEGWRRAYWERVKQNTTNAVHLKRTQAPLPQITGGTPTQHTPLIPAHQPSQSSQSQFQSPGYGQPVSQPSLSIPHAIPTPSASTPHAIPTPPAAITATVTGEIHVTTPAYFTRASALVDTQDRPTPRLGGAPPPPPDCIHPGTARHHTFSQIRDHYVHAGIFRPGNQLRDRILQERYH